MLSFLILNAERTAKNKVNQINSCRMSEREYNFGCFEVKSHFTLNQLYKNWDTNGWGKSPICIPAAMEVDDKWFIRTLDPNAVDYNKRVINKRLGKLRGDNAERIVHQAFQRSNIGGILIQGVDYALLWNVLKKSADISYLKELLKPSQNGGINMFEIDFLLFHPTGGIFAIECKAYDESKKSLIKVCKDAIWQAERASERLLSVLKMLTGVELPFNLIHVVLCLPNVNRKDSITGMEHINILDAQDLKDSSRFNAFWEAQLMKYSVASTNYFENMLVTRLLALTFGFRSAKFTSLASNSLEIFRKIDRQESSESKKAPFASGNKIIFLNSEQLTAYNIAKSGQNMLLFGPPGSGKTLLIQLLAKEASEKEGKGRVVVILPYEELATMYENFFKANRENQKRKIVINPSRAELKGSLASDSFDDIFADEILYCGWIPRESSPNRQILVGITTGRRYEKSRISFAREKLEKRLTSANFYFFELKSVMRNTGNICKYYSQFEEESNNEIIIGHNIEGSNVIEIATSDTKNASIEIANRIKQYLGKEGEDSRHSKNYFCSPADIAVLVAHEPVYNQINQIKKALKEVGIESGSIIEQLVAKATNLNPIVAVDCSANVLSLEWPIVFVVNATQCPFSRNLSSPIVSYSRAVSALIVVNTRQCKKCLGIWICKIAFPHFYFSFFKEQDLFLYNDRIAEENLNQLGRCIFRILFWCLWTMKRTGFPFLLLFLYLLLFQLYFDDQCCTAGDIMYLSMTLIILLLCFISALISFKVYKHYAALLIELVILLSLSALIGSLFSQTDFGYLFSSKIGLLLMSSLLYLMICIVKLSVWFNDWSDLYFPRNNSVTITSFIFLHFLSFICIALLFYMITYGEIAGRYSVSLFSILIFIPIQFNLCKLSFRSKPLKNISFIPL